MLSFELKENLSKYRLNEDEYTKICGLLGREPKGVEWALFSALWSEHCSYKSSKVHLKNFFSESERLVEGFGENAGVIDLGQGERVAFKMESHNHPSFIEPYQGAATGVGGILRDIFTMGARPLALGNYLCFGHPKAARMKELVHGVVHGISGYGNCVGVANITGQTEFHESYDENILVNAFALGYFGKKDVLVTSRAKGLGNYIVYVGAKTGRDGIHGASMASESFEEGSESKRPTIQIGDPFYEKLLIESCIEVINQDLVVAIQDMGAAGLTSSSFEMASKGGIGFDIQLDAVPLRDPTMSPEDVLLSESQERMLLVCVPEKFEAIKKVFDQWNLEATIIGKIIKEKTVRLHWHGEVIADIDPDLLTENAPEYKRKYGTWNKEFTGELSDKQKNQLEVSEEEYLSHVFSNVISSPKNWIYDQYDQRVGSNTAKDCSEPVGVIVLPESQRSLGIVLGCRPSLMRASAYIGAMDAVYYPAIELALKGIEPLAVTDCLNFGNPEKENVMTDFVATVEGMSAACESIQTPVISGNVSFYNETRGKNITSTPSTGLVGLGGDPLSLPSSNFKNTGDLIYKITTSKLMTFSGQLSEILNNEIKPWLVGELNTKDTAKFIFDLKNLVIDEKPKATRSVGKFGLFYALYKMADANFGADIDLDFEDATTERLYEVVVVITPNQKEAFEKSLNSKNLDFKAIGKVNSTGELKFKAEDSQDAGQLGSESVFKVNELKQRALQSWETAFGK